MKMSISTQQVQKQILAPSMQQSIEVLLLPILDLTMAIDQELQNNPLLETNEESKEQTAAQIEEEIRQRLEHDQYRFDFSYQSFFSDDDIIEESPIKKEISLEEILLQQLRIEISHPLGLKIGEYIIGNIDANGYLKPTCEEIADALDIDNTEIVEHVLKTVQGFEPIGIASRNLRECLLTQARFRFNGNHDLIYAIISDHLDKLGRKKYQDIARALGVSLDKVRETARAISSLEPKPARNYSSLTTNIYIKPDVFLIKSPEKGYQIHINDREIPSLKISPFYRNMLKRPNLTEDEREFIKEKLKNALSFIKSIEQRGRTIRRISEYILEKQKDFFEHGHMSLTPMTLRDVAHALDRNESTISRAISHKYIDTPKGIFPIKFFFSQGVSENINGPVASRSIKEEIKALIHSEDKSAPLSDRNIQKYFEGKDMQIARRTISKYRQILNILPSHLRKE